MPAFHSLSHFALISVTALVFFTSNGVDLNISLAFDFPAYIFVPNQTALNFCQGSTNYYGRCSYQKHVCLLGGIIEVSVSYVGRPNNKYMSNAMAIIVNLLYERSL